MLDSILLHTPRSQRLPRRLWAIVEAQARCAEGVWREPDQGIWEARGKPQHYVSSKLLCWVALDRAAELAEIRSGADLASSWRATADEIKQDILTRGPTEAGVLRQHYETDSLDASTLLAAMFGFLSGSDARLRASVLAVADDLTVDGFVLRYRADETDDGLAPRSLRGGIRRRHRTTPRQLPQAFSHLALIEAAGRIIAHERLDEFS